MIQVETINGLELKEIIEDGFGLSDYDTVMSKLETATRPANFGSYDRVPVLSNTNYITVKQFFEDNDYFCGEKISLDEIDELLSENEYYEYKMDNTYNYGGYFENEMNFIVAENVELDETIVFFAVHVGLDVRAGYTPYFAIKFDTEYDFTEMLLAQFESNYVKYTHNKKEFFISVYVSPMNEYADIYIADEESNYAHDFQEPLSICNDDIIEELERILTDNDVPFDNESFEIQ